MGHFLSALALTTSWQVIIDYMFLRRGGIMCEKKRAWIYARIDAPEDIHGSLKHQDQLLCEYAGSMEFKVVGHSQDLASAYDMYRPGLQALTDAVVDGKVDVLLVISPLRISRDLQKVATYEKFLQYFDVQTYSPEIGRSEELACLKVEKLFDRIQQKNKVVG